jgi:hypothetical protein
MSIRVSDAIRKFYPKARFTMSTDDDYEHLTWLSDDIPKPTKEELLEKVEQLRVERPLKDLRIERDRRLTECDWVTLRSYSTDIPVPDEWKTYMQALRDLPSVTEDPANPVWPVRPDKVVAVVVEEETSNVVVEKETSNVVVEEETSNVVVEKETSNVVVEKETSNVVVEEETSNVVVE